ncbi:MAG: hypothetical protein Udaeo_12910 [Candidatus Udaeobacter sp.]|nr:MAG: hypothetical protein Udaeo_12910 [Candidatus Udaeobacter sp.]
MQQLPEHSTTVADVCHEEICSGWLKRNLHFGKLFLQISATFVCNALGFAQVRFIIERRDRAGVCDAVHVEWLSRLVKHFSHRRRRNSVADADPGKTVNLRERTEHNDVSAVANKSKCVGRIIEEFEIRLVKNDDDAVRHSRHETVDGALRDQCAGGIVWVWNENDPGFCGDRVQCCIEVLLIIRTRRFNRAHAESRRE